MKLEIVNIPSPILHQKSNEITKIDNELKTLINDMSDTLYNANGLGLSAVQIGVLKRVVIIDVDYNREKNEKGDKIKNPQIFLNPVITWKSNEIEQMEEGCLSVPGAREKIKRHLEIEVEYQDMELKKHTLKTDGLLAHVLQHEIDHTNGIVYIDYLSKLKRDIIVGKVKKMMRE